MSYTRYAVFYVPPRGTLAEFGATWLGWDIAFARAASQPALPGLPQVTTTPRRYGFHATLKPPFRLRAGTGRADLLHAVSDMAASCAPARCEGLGLSRLGRFLALTPRGDESGIARVAATCVEALDAFRAPADDAELARRRKGGLPPRQDALLLRWGYPHVMDEFRFHMTLTGRLPAADVAHWAETLRAHLPALPEPFVLDEVALVGERADGRFELVRRYALGG